jgi:hypothetical protein
MESVVAGTEEGGVAGDSGTAGTSRPTVFHETASGAFLEPVDALISGASASTTVAGCWAFCVNTTPSLFVGVVGFKGEVVVVRADGVAVGGGMTVAGGWPFVVVVV